MVIVNSFIVNVFKSVSFIVSSSVFITLLNILICNYFSAFSHTNPLYCNLNLFYDIYISLHLGETQLVLQLQKVRCIIVSGAGESVVVTAPCNELLS